MSHPLGVRELKLRWIDKVIAAGASHPLGVRELKHRIAAKSVTERYVAPFRGA